VQADESPIIVTGLGRSGTTWMQWFLSQHPRIHVHGQLPRLPWTTVWNWYAQMAAQGAWAEWANQQVGYDVSHYAGSSPERCRLIFRRMLGDFLTGMGPPSPRWGAKILSLCADPTAVRDFESLWPETRWVVCVRDPFRTIASAMATFDPALDVRDWASNWINTCKFVESHDLRRTVLVQMDQLDSQSNEERLRAMRRVLRRVGERRCPETDAFVGCWPVVHRVARDTNREAGLSLELRHRLAATFPELVTYQAKMGYDGTGQLPPATPACD